MTECRTFVMSVIAAGTLIASGVAAAQGYPWRNHEPNYTFVFGNAFDTHQQTRLTPLPGASPASYTCAISARSRPMAIRSHSTPTVIR